MAAAPNTGRWATVPDYIYGITRAIWEDRGVGRDLARYYDPDVVVRAPTGLTIGSAGVVADTLATLHQFPDRRLIGEDVIWSDGGDGTFLSSHRLISVMRHLGDGAFGEASGRLVKSRIIADCWVKAGRVAEEWLVRDGAAFARALGLTPRELAQRSVDADRAAGQAPQFFLPEHDQASAYTASVADDAAVEAYIEGHRRIWEDKSPAAIHGLYAEGAQVSAPGGLTLNGHAEIDRWCIGILASVPDARFTVESATVLREPERPVRVALRWSLRGRHLRFGHFGAPTGRELYLMAMSHAHLSGGKVTAEWLLLDEVAIWKQIFAADD